MTRVRQNSRDITFFCIAELSSRKKKLKSAMNHHSKKATLRSYAEGLDFVYINPLLAVCKAPRSVADTERLARHFKSIHPHNHQMVNVCKSSNPLLTSRYYDSAEEYPGPLSLKQLIFFTSRAESYSSVNPRGVLVLTCENGCEKSCVFAAAFLLHNGAALSAEEAISMINKERSPDANLALSKPSLVRYVAYYEALLRSDQDSFMTNTFFLSRLRLRGGVPNLNKSLLKPGCKLHVTASMVSFVPMDGVDFGFAVANNAATSESAVNGDPEGREQFVENSVFDQLQSAYDGDLENAPFYPQTDTSTTIDLDLSMHDLALRGDVTLHIYSEEQCVICFSFHTAFVTNGYMQLEKDVLDVAYLDDKHKLLPEACQVEVFLTGIDDRPALNVQVQEQDR